jgi:UDP-MurNAc hydroxylase
MFRVEYKYSACIKIITDDTRILCDPWFGSSAYDGTWQQFPRIKDKIKLVGDFDFIYISHIHPDHYCGETISELIHVLGDKKILIADWQEHQNFLAKKLASDGFQDHLEISNELLIGDTLIKIIPNRTGSFSDIDSALIVSSLKSRKSVLNINDCLLNQNFCDSINEFKKRSGIEFTLFCLGYTGAGPYPQTYYSPIREEKKLLQQAQSKKEQFFKRYLTAISKIESKRRLPFAGKYVLKGDLSFLNKYRGVADALEVKEIDPGAIVLADGGDAYFDLETSMVSEERDERYNIPAYIPADTDYLWRRAVGFMPSDSLLKRLIVKAVQNAHAKSECIQDCLWTIHPYRNPSELIYILNAEKPWEDYNAIITFNCNKNSNPLKDVNCNAICHSHMFIETKALFAALTGITHWNNYEVGSVKQVRRIPDVFIAEMNTYLNFFSVI